MSPTTQAFLLSWDLRGEVILLLLLLGAAQYVGWKRLRRRSQGRFANLWRLFSYQGGLLVLGLALMSPIDVLGGQLFFMHMIQHLLLVMVAPPLLLLANPFPTFIWALPRDLRPQVSRLFQGKSQVRRLLAQVTAPGIVWMVYLFFLLGWHDANAYNWSLRNEWVHDLEHLTFFGSAMLFWWHVIGAGPRIHRRFPIGLRIAYVLSAVPPTMLTGVAIAFATTPIYTYYTTVPRFWGIDVMYDQMLGGIIMWVPGSMMYILAALIMLARVFTAEEKTPLLQISEWSTDEAMIAPGLEHRARQAKLRKLLSR